MNIRSILFASVFSVALPCMSLAQVSQGGSVSPVGTSSKNATTVQGASSGVPIKMTCTSGCGSAGTSSNASDGVTTSSTNGQNLSWLYGFNGSTWDRLRDDTNKYMFVDIGAPLGTQTLGNSVAVTDLSLQAGGAALAAISAGTETVNSTAGNTSIQISGVDGSNNVRVPGVDGAGGNLSVSVKNTPAVTVSSGNVAISNTPAVTVSSGNITETNFPATVDTNTGAAGANTVRVVQANGATTAITKTQYSATDASGTITTGGTFQTVATANSYHFCQIANTLSATYSSEPLYVHWTTAVASTSNSTPLGPGGVFIADVINNALSVTAATAGHLFSVGCG